MGARLRPALLVTAHIVLAWLPVLPCSFSNCPALFLTLHFATSLCDQDPQPVCIRAKGFCAGASCRHKQLVIPRRLMEHDTRRMTTICGASTGYSAPLQVLKPVVEIATLSHTSPWASVNSSLTLTIKTNVPLFKKVNPLLTLELSTAHNSQTPAGTLDVMFGGMATTATWDPSAGTLVMLLPMDTMACTSYNMTFTLQNSRCQNDAPTTHVVISSGSACSIARNMWTEADAAAGVCFDRKQITAVPLQACSVSSSPLQVHLLYMLYMYIHTHTVD